VILLIILHHIADVAWQPSWLVENKKKHLWSIYEHCVIWAGVISLGLYTIGGYSMWKFFFLLIGHFIIDVLRYRVFTDWKWIYLDQTLHYLQLLIVYATN